MKVVTNQSSRRFVLDEATKLPGADGDSYRIQGSQNAWVKLLKDTSRQRMQEIETQIRNNGVPGEGQPIEVVYSRGRFAGYKFMKSEPAPAPERDPEPTPPPGRGPRRNSGGGLMDSSLGLVLGFVIVAAGLGLLQKFVLFQFYCSAMLPRFSESVASVCYRAGVAGLTGIIAGVVVMLLFLIKIPKDNFVLFVILEAVGFVIGLLVIDFILPLLVYAGMIVYAFLPIIIIIAVVVLILRAKMRRRSRRRR